MDSKEMAQFILNKVLCADLKTQHIGKLDLTQNQKLLLRTLHSARENEDEVTMTDLSRMLFATKSATSQTVSKLERKGIVKRSWARCDRRRVLVSLTAKGSAIIGFFYSGILLNIQKRLEKLQDDEKEILFNLFLKCME